MKGHILLFFISFIVSGYTNAEIQILDIESTIQDKQFDEATKMIDKLLSKSKDSTDYLLYLKALSLFYSNNIEDSIAVCDKIINDYNISAWYRKAIFLKCQCLMQLKRFESAEKIYNDEVQRLLSTERKEEITKIYFNFAELLSKKPGKNELDAIPPNYNKAYEIYKKVLEFEVGDGLKDEVMFRLGRMKQLAGDYEQSIRDYTNYLDEFDPTWTDQQKLSENSKHLKIGIHIYEARYYLAECQFNIGNYQLAKIYLEDLMKKQDSKDEKLFRNTRYLLIKTYDYILPYANRLELKEKEIKSYISDFPNDYRSFQLAYELAEKYFTAGRSEEAIKSYQAFLEAKSDLSKIIDIEEQSIAIIEQIEKMRMSATYRIGEILFSQKDYTSAIDMWNKYINQYPDGPQWADAQRSIINAEFHRGMDLLAQEKYDEMKTTLDRFLEKYPLDDRSRQIMFIYGQLFYHKGQEDQDYYKKAISEWERLINKYPDTEESSLALLRIGQIYEEKLGDLEKALESYQKLNWGSWAEEAKNRIKAMTEKKLEVVTERAYRTNENARVKVSLRNIEKLTINLYKLDLEAYWRKTHRITGIEDLDIVLISPDVTKEYKVTNYQKYKLIEDHIDIPMDGAGVYAVHISEDDLEATTLVIRSDIDAIIKTSRSEIFVFVEDMINIQPLQGARVLVSNGINVIAEGDTNKDGVFQKVLDEIDDTSNISVLVIKDNNIASNMLSLHGLELSKGLSPRGYIYTDRPAYRPGQKVYIKGIIRDVKDGVYFFSPNTIYELAITDPQGRAIRSEDISLSEFGTFYTEIMLDENAPVGEYWIIVKDREDNSKNFTGSFIVQHYQLEKIKLSIDFPRRVFMRGEKIEATFTASYYYGQPVINHIIRYTLPDGRSYAQQTDNEGKVKVEFDTTPMIPGSMLTFSGNIEGENVPPIIETIFLAELDFSVEVTTNEKEIISGENFNITVTTKSIDGKPIGLELLLSIYQIKKQPSHPIISQVPWLEDVEMHIHDVEVKVGEYKVVTDKNTGKGQIEIKLDQGGDYIIRATGNDRFGQPVSGECAISISDDKDKVKLRIYADDSKLKVGEKVKIRIHSRILDTSNISLVTFEGESIINYKIMKLNKGWNELEFTVENKYFPNFLISISSMSQENNEKTPILITATRDFTVERQLNFTLKTSEYYKPGESAEVEINVCDQLNNPLKAEISLSLVESALFLLYPDTLMPITSFFTEGIHRYSAMRTVSSCSFQYKSLTKQVMKELLEEDKRLVLEEQERREMEEARLELETAVISDRARKMADNGKIFSYSSKAIGAGDAVKGYHAVEGDSLKRDAGLMAELKPYLRQEISDVGYWIPSIVTDANGKAKVKITMPEKITQWQIRIRGCTTETIVGQTDLNIITRKDFFIDAKLPSILTEGDKIRVLARVHNLCEFEGKVKVSLKLKIDDDISVDEREINITKNGVSEVIFNSMVIKSGGSASFEITAIADDLSDGIVRIVPIRPYGMEYVDNKSGISLGNEIVFLELPSKQKYNNKTLNISVKASVNRMIFEIAMNIIMPIERSLTNKTTPISSDNGNDLIAVSYAIGYLRKIGGNATEIIQLTEYAKNLISNIVLKQNNDGGWSWCSVNPSIQSDIYVSSRNLWGLSEARRQGLSVNPSTIDKAVVFLNKAFPNVEQSNDNAKSIILHALSTIDSADFSYANRLYRNRNELSPSALAYAALTFINLNRNEIGGEILDVLTSKKLESMDIEAIALGLLAMENIRPESPLVRVWLEYIISKYTIYGFYQHKAKGPIVASLATYYGETQFTKNDYSLKILVNGENIKSLTVKENQPSIFINVASKFLKEGKNKVEFIFEGRGTYTYTATLSGFSTEIIDPKSWAYPYIQSRKYYHTPLEYKGRKIAYSSMELSQLPDKARTNVSVSIKEGRSDRYIIINEYLPAGSVLVKDSITGNHQHYEIGDGMFTLYYLPGMEIKSFSYQLASFVPGTYRALPTIIRDAMNPEYMRIGETSYLEILAPGEISKDEYKMNDTELYEFGKAYFDDGKYDESVKLLSQLYSRNREYNQRDIARMLLWIHTEDNYYDAHKIIEYFEILRERFPELYIPFDKIIVVAKAYRDIGEYERACLVYKATIDASFVSDSGLSAALQDEGLFFSSINFQEDLWREYPDTPLIISAYFALSQALYSRAGEVEQILKTELKFPILKTKIDAKKATKIEMIKETAIMLWQFLTLYPSDPLSDDAAFSMSNALLDLKDFTKVVNLCRNAKKRYPDSKYINSFQYVEALGLFWQRKYDEAVLSAKVISDGKSEDCDLAKYIIGQIYHAQGKPELAIEWYQKVRDIYPDADESIKYFEQKRLSIDEVSVFRPKDKIDIKIRYRNIKELSIQVYNVDLMKLYIREKDLSKINQIHLAGIKPKISNLLTLGDGKDYIDKDRIFTLDIKDEGAYLVICRGDDIFTSGLVLVTPLEVEVQEDATSGRVRVYVRDVINNTYKEGVHVKVIGSAEKIIKSGKTDLRGLFIADNIKGIATVIARDDKDRYSFYRGKQWLVVPTPSQKYIEKQEPKIQADYLSNIRVINQSVQSENIMGFDQMRRSKQKGIQVQKAY